MSVTRLSSRSTTTDRLIAELLGRQNARPQAKPDPDLIADVIRLFGLRVNSLLELLGGAE
jgi:hypothetical protein